jgi:hypothetical protein
MKAKLSRISRVRKTKGSAVRPTYSPEGVDLTLIRWFLTLTPMERLRKLEMALKSGRCIRDVSPLR